MKRSGISKKDTPKGKSSSRCETPDLAEDKTRWRRRSSSNAGAAVGNALQRP